jgi:hypothetical protein
MLKFIVNHQLSKSNAQVHPGLTDIFSLSCLLEGILISVFRLQEFIIKLNCYKCFTLHIVTFQDVCAADYHHSSHKLFDLNLKFPV